MSIHSIPSSLKVPAQERVGGEQTLSLGAGKPQPDEVARQFEAILVRQMLSESMKPLLQNGKAGQAYSFMLTDALAEGITKGGGLGLRNVIEAQLRHRENGGHTASLE